MESMDQDNNTQNILEQYRRDAIYTASAEQLTLMLYDAALINVKDVRVAIMDGAHDVLSRSRKGRDILVALAETVNMSHEFGPKLRDLYLYCWRTLLDAAMAKNTSGLDSVEEVLSNLSQGLRDFRTPAGGGVAAEERLTVNFSG